MGVDVVTLLHVLQDIIEVGRHAFGLQFIVAALGTDFRRGSDKDLQFGIREDSGADVTAVHHHPLVLAHLLLLGDHRCTYKGDGCDGTHMVGDLERPDLFFDALAVEVGVWTSALWVELERDVDVLHLLFEGIGIDAAVFKEQTMTKGVEGDRAVHGTCVYIDISDLPGEVFGHRALAARGVAVDGNGNFFHNEYDTLNINDDALTWYLP